MNYGENKGSLEEEQERGVKMTVSERILTIRLLERLQRNPSLAEKLLIVEPEEENTEASTEEE